MFSKLVKLNVLFLFLGLNFEPVYAVKNENIYLFTLDFLPYKARCQLRCVSKELKRNVDEKHLINLLTANIGSPFVSVDKVMKCYLGSHSTNPLHHIKDILHNVLKEEMFKELERVFVFKEGSKWLPTLLAPTVLPHVAAAGGSSDAAAGGAMLKEEHGRVSPEVFFGADYLPKVASQGYVFIIKNEEFSVKSEDQVTFFEKFQKTLNVKYVLYDGNTTDIAVFGSQKVHVVINDRHLLPTDNAEIIAKFFRDNASVTAVLDMGGEEGIGSHILTGNFCLGDAGFSSDDEPDSYVLQACSEDFMRGYPDAVEVLDNVLCLYNRALPTNFRKLHITNSKGNVKRILSQCLSMNKDDDVGSSETIVFRGFNNVHTIDEEFLYSHPAKKIEFHAFGNVSVIGDSFLAMEYKGPCTTLDLSSFRNLREIGDGFLSGGSFQTVCLPSLMKLNKIPHAFLRFSQSLKKLDVSSLANVEEIEGYFLGGCHELEEIDLSLLRKLRKVGDDFLEDCLKLPPETVLPLKHVERGTDFFDFFSAVEDGAVSGEGDSAEDSDGESHSVADEEDGVNSRPLKRTKGNSA